MKSSIKIFKLNFTYLFLELGSIPLVMNIISIAYSHFCSNNKDMMIYLKALIVTIGFSLFFYCFGIYITKWKVHEICIIYNNTLFIIKHDKYSVLKISDLQWIEYNVNLFFITGKFLIHSKDNQSFEMHSGYCGPPFLMSLIYLLPWLRYKFFRIFS